MTSAELEIPEATGRTELKVSVADDAHRKLRTKILRGEIHPGHKLKFENLQQEMSVSASSLREALTRLVSDGFVTSEPRRGFSVAPVSIEELKDISRLRSILEPLA